MAKSKSILKKFADTLKDVAKTATDAAAEALKADRPVAARRGRRTDYLPLAGDGFVSDPLMMPPPIAPRGRRKSRTAMKRAASTPARKRGKATTKRTAKSARRKAATASASRKTGRTTKGVTKRSTAKSRRR